MKFLRVLTEVRERALTYLKKLAPNWPEYVLKDFVYNNYKNYMDEAEDVMMKWAQNIGYASIQDVIWKFETLNLAIDSFDKDTVANMKKREFGKSNPFQVGRDQERTAGAKERLQKNGPSKEPIIMVKRLDGKFELIEGFHRTMQSLLLWPKGYQQPTYYAIAKSEIKESPFPSNS
jgi:hypothetical protein